MVYTQASLAPYLQCNFMVFLLKCKQEFKLTSFAEYYCSRFEANK